MNGRREKQYWIHLRQLDVVEHLMQRELGHPAKWLVEFVRHDPRSDCGLAEAPMFFFILEYDLVIKNTTPFEPVHRASHPTRSATTSAGPPSRLLTPKLPLRLLAPAPPPSG